MSGAAFKALGALLLYPTEELRLALPAIGEALAGEAAIAPATRQALGRLLETMRVADPLDLEEAYVGLFDRQPSLSLHLFEHVYGESRERGQAMLELRKTYESAGFEPTTHELPDYVPLLCEFVALAPSERALPLLADAAPVLAGLRRRLEERRSLYSSVFAALVELSGVACDDEPGAARASGDSPVEDPEGDLDALDRSWEERPVTFGAGDLDAAMSGAALRAHHGRETMSSSRGHGPERPPGRRDGKGRP